MKKVIHFGDVPNYHGTHMKVFCEIIVTNGNLSITGVEGPRKGGNCKGACGQINMHLDGMQGQIRLSKGWTREMVAKFFRIWEEWHLNDMQSASPCQRAWLNEGGHKADLLTYEERKKALEAAGLSPDPSYLHKGKPYVYGTAWLRKEIPQDVLDWLATLPNTDVEPAWV